MKRYLGVIGLAAVMAIGGAAVASAGTAWETCYVKQYEPAKYKVKRVRKLIRKEFWVWKNLHTRTGLVRRVRHPRVYVEKTKRRLVRRDAYILRQVPCR